MKIKILKPKDGEYVRHAVPVKGAYEDLKHGLDLWMVIMPESMRNYHPQGAPAALGNGIWNATAYVGNRTPGADAGISFELLAIVADKKASDVFRNYIIEASRFDEWPGLNELPTVAEIADKITIVRHDEKARTAFIKKDIDKAQRKIILYVSEPNHIAQYMNKEIPLSKTPFKVLYLLTKKAVETKGLGYLKREEIEEVLYGIDAYIDPQQIDDKIRDIRNAFGSISKSTGRDIVETKKGIGYRLTVHYNKIELE